MESVPNRSHGGGATDFIATTSGKTCVSPDGYLPSVRDEPCAGLPEDFKAGRTTGGVRLPPREGRPPKARKRGPHPGGGPRSTSIMLSNLSFCGWVRRATRVSAVIGEQKGTVVSLSSRPTGSARGCRVLPAGAAVDRQTNHPPRGGLVSAASCEHKRERSCAEGEGALPDELHTRSLR